MINWSEERGVATEANIDRFIASVFGERLDKIFPDAKFQNADYVFHERKVIIELKILETEFGSTEQFFEKETLLYKDIAAKFGLGPILRGEQDVLSFYELRKRNMYRAPLARITKKANRQIRETKLALRDTGYRGLLWLINDSFRHIDSALAISLLCSTLVASNSSVAGLIYATNHYVCIPGNDFANLLWVPAYADGEADDLPDFVNWLGTEWGNFCEAEIGKFDSRFKTDYIDLLGVRPIIE